MKEKETTESVDTIVNIENRKLNEQASVSQNKTDKIYQVACTFPILQFKGVEEGEIPGIMPYEFNDKELHNFLYNGNGRLWNSREGLLLEFLLNLSDPYLYKEFNFGRAMNLWDYGHIFAALGAIEKIVNG